MYLIARDTPESKAIPTALEWNPNGQLGLVCVDSEGCVNTFEGMVPSSDSVRVCALTYILKMKHLTNTLCLI